MSILSNLVQHCDGQQFGSLLLCQSPKGETTAPDPRERLSCSSKTNSLSNIQRSSKSLSKIDLMKIVGKVDPKERILHRIAYKLEMKCRKHYYNFWVKLENYNKLSLKAEKANPKNISDIQGGVDKLSQISSILYSKYFEQSLKKYTFRYLKFYGAYMKGLEKIVHTLDKLEKRQAFTYLLAYAQKREKQIMRMDIFTSAARTIVDSQKAYLRRKLLSSSFSNIVLFAKSHEQKFQQDTTIHTERKIEQREREAFTPIKKRESTKQLCETYHSLKKKAHQRDISPCKVTKKIEIARKESHFNFSRKMNYLKSCKIVTNISQKPFSLNVQNDSFTVTQKSQPDLLNTRQMNDLYDKNALFFAPEFGQKSQSLDIAESSVRSINYETKSLSEFLFDEDEFNKFDDRAKLSIISKNSKDGTFGSQAVNFKNSLVFQRESAKTFKVLTPQVAQKEVSFAKKLRHMQLQPELLSSCSRDPPVLKSSVRPSSAEKSRSICPSNQQLPVLNLGSLNQTYHTAEPDFQRLVATNRTIKSDNVKSDTKRSNFIKLSKQLEPN